MNEPGTPSWSPRTEADVRLASEHGHLEEGHHLDVKRELEPGKAANRELAKDIASFALHGGLLLYGVDEKARPPALTPVVLAGLAERIDQVARTAVSPPLYVRTKIIECESDPNTGYIAVHVPPSGDAPHMAAERYWGRSDKTKYPLPDAEVRALHAHLRASEDEFKARVESVLRDAPGHGRVGTYAAVAAPVGAYRPLLAQRNQGSSWSADSVSAVLSTGGDVYPSYSPSFTLAQTAEQRPRGVAVFNGMRSGRRLPEEESEGRLRTMVEVLFIDDGSIEASIANASGLVPGGVKIVEETLIVGETRHMLALALDVAHFAGFTGSWQVGVALDRLHNGVASRLHKVRSPRAQPYPDNTYTRVTTVIREELERAPDAVVGRLTLPLLLPLGVERQPDFATLHTTNGPAT